MLSNKGVDLGADIGEIAIDNDPLLSQVVVYVTLAVVVDICVFISIQDGLEYLIEGFIPFNIDLE